MKTETVNDYTPEEREAMLQKMRASSDTFYRLAAATGCHPFLEFCGLMNEYILICQKAHEQGIDFPQANAHTGQRLPLQDHHVAYLGEKLNCIYGPSITDAHALVRAITGTDVEAPAREELAKQWDAAAVLATRYPGQPGVLRERAQEIRFGADFYICKCGASHGRGPINGVDVYRCMACGETGRGPSPSAKPPPQAGRQQAASHEDSGP